jgi:hypothetical protein
VPALCCSADVTSCVLLPLHPFLQAYFPSQGSLVKIGELSVRSASEQGLLGEWHKYTG